MIVADTDVLIDFLAGVEPLASRVAEQIEAGLATTAVSRFELRAGVRSARQEQTVSGRGRRRSCGERAARAREGG